MIRYFIFLLLFCNSLFSLDLTNFDDRQTAVREIKTMILKEELFSKAYEEYILENYALPSSGNLVGASALLESTFITEIDTDLFNQITIDSLTTLSYALKTVLSDDAYLKNLYEGNTFRKRTFISGGKVVFKLEDDFAKQLSYLLSKLSSQKIDDCSILTKTRYCKENNHLYIYDDDNETNRLMYYHKDKFKTGPIIISTDITLYDNVEYSFIPKGAILYDEDGMKYVKTVNSIEQVR